MRRAAATAALALVSYVAGCSPRPARALHLGDAPAAVAWGAAGAWIAVTDARAPRLRLLSPDLRAHTLEAPWPADPRDGSVPFGESLAASGDAGEPLFAAGGFFPSYLGDSGEGRITVWNGDGRAVRELRAPAIVALGRLAFLPGRRLAALVHVPIPGTDSDRHGAIYVWDLASGTGPDPWVFPRVGAVRDVDFDAAGRRVALLAADGPYVADVSSDGAAPPRALPLGGRAADAIALSPDGSTLAAGRADGVALLALAGPGAGSAPRRLAAGAFAALRFAPAGAPRLAALGSDGRLRVLAPDGGAARTIAHGVRAFAWSPDGSALATLVGHGRLAVWGAR